MKLTTPKGGIYYECAWGHANVKGWRTGFETQVVVRF